MRFKVSLVISAAIDGDAQLQRLYVAKPPVHTHAQANFTEFSEKSGLRCAIRKDFTIFKLTVEGVGGGGGPIRPARISGRLNSADRSAVAFVLRPRASSCTRVDFVFDTKTKTRARRRP